MYVAEISIAVSSKVSFGTSTSTSCYKFYSLEEATLEYERVKKSMDNYRGANRGDQIEIVSPGARGVFYTGEVLIMGLFDYSIMNEQMDGIRSTFSNIFPQNV